MKTPRFRRAKNSLCGRIVCRLLGEEKGAVLMEYVLLALLIAAAAVAGLMVFSKSIRVKIYRIVGITTEHSVEGVGEQGKGLKEDDTNVQTVNDTTKDIGDDIGGSIE